MSAGWLDDLNPMQREAVTWENGPLLVVAGAGTGKTKTLVSRVAYLIEQGTNPQRILLLTFTRRAAAEMIRRVKALLQIEGASGVWAGTFHAVANRLLRQHGKQVGVSSDFTIMDESDAADLMNLIRDELGLAKSQRRFPKKETLLSIYSRTVNAKEKLGHTLQKHFPWCADDQDGIRAIFEQYTQRKRKQQTLDYDDLLLYWHALCLQPDSAAHIGELFDHILVDEYQDTNAIQAEILRCMRQRNCNIMAVGDDAQSIYSFRAATVRNILDFSTHFPNTHTATLEQNYRSTQPILDASNAVIAESQERHDKSLWTTRSSGQKPLLLTCQDEHEQCAAVCERILEHLESGIPLHRQAVLFRAGHHSDQLEVELARRNIPFHKFGGLKFVEAAHVKDVLAILRILENPYDEIGWFRILLLLEGIGTRTARRLITELGIRSDPTAATRIADLQHPIARLIRACPRVPSAAASSFESLRKTLAHCHGVHIDSAQRKTIQQPGLHEQLQHIRAFYEPIFERIYENPSIRIRDIDQLEQIAMRYKSRSNFVTDLTLDPPNSTSDLAQAPYLDDDYLILSTIHSSKGCEWDIVHIIHAADGMIPSDMAIVDDEGIEEERRLFYVAMTRTKQVLYVYFPLRYYHRKHAFGDSHSYAQLTRYLPESMQHLIEIEQLSQPLDQSRVDKNERVDSWLKDLWNTS